MPRSFGSQIMATRFALGIASCGGTCQQAYPRDLAWLLRLAGERRGEETASQGADERSSVDRASVWPRGWEGGTASGSNLHQGRGPVDHDCSGFPAGGRKGIASSHVSVVCYRAQLAD